MNKRTLKLLKLLNKKLKEEHQNLRIISYRNDYVKLSNGIKLYGKNNRQKIYNRIKNQKKYLKKFDELYSKDKRKNKETEKELKREICKIGGLKCQEKHRDKIKKNLNTGIPWNKGIKLPYDTWQKGLTKETHISLKRLSENRKGSGNPMFGKKMSLEKRKVISELMKDKIKNGEFTPNIHNSNTHWQTTYKNKKYRSSWEAAFFSINPNFKYEKLRIEYFIGNERKIYIVDFVDYNKKIAVEIKPKSHRDDKKFVAKEKALKKWCIDNNFIYKIISEDYFYENFDDIDFKNMDKNSVSNIWKVKKRYENKINKKN
jgi:hypothetical protein